MTWIKRLSSQPSQLPNNLKNGSAETMFIVSHNRIRNKSIKGERDESLLPIVAGTDLKVVALCMSDEGMPKTTDDRMAIADKLVNSLLQKNVAIDNIYVDPLVQPIATETTFGTEFLNAYRAKKFEV